MEKIGLQAILDDKDFQAGLSRYQSGLNKAESSTKKTAGAMSAFGHTISTALGTAMGILTSQAIPKLVEGLGSFISEAAAAEQGDAALEAVLKSTKGVAGLTADAINDMANALSEVTPFEDDAIKGGQSLLLTFTNIGKNVFPDATEVMLDMSQALGQDLKSSAIQLGKALQDPTDGVSALQRVGVNFNDTQKKTIEQLVKAGKVEQAQKFILAELKTEFGGAAKAAGTTFAGQLKILNNQFGNIKEEIGTALLPILKNLTGFIGRNILPIIKRFATDYMPKIVRLLDGVGQAFGQLFESLAAGDLESGVSGFVSMLLQAIGVSEDFSIKVGDAFAGVAKSIQDIIASFKAGGLVGGLQEIGNQLGNAFKNIDWTAVSKNLDGLKTRFWEWLTGKGGVLETVGAQLGKVVTAIGGWLGDTKNTQPIVDAVMGWVGQFWTWLTDPKSGAIILVAEKMGELINQIRQWSESPKTKRQFEQIGETVARTVIDGIYSFFSNSKNITPSGEALGRSLTRIPDNIRSVLSNIGGSIASGIIQGIISYVIPQGDIDRIRANISAWMTAAVRAFVLGDSSRLVQMIIDAILGKAPAPTPAGGSGSSGFNPTTNPSVPYTGTEYTEGGPVRRTGMALVHAGEYVLNRQQAMAWAPALASTSTVYNFNHTWPAAVPPSQREWTESMVRRVTQQEVRGILGKG